MSSRSSRTASERSSSPEDTITRSSLRKHICPQCQRAFSTSGHLARHSRVHTGQRDHACPFPGCTTRCSRQDNLQQHYRVHLSPKSRNLSTAAARAAMARTIALQQAQRQHQQRLDPGIFGAPMPTSYAQNVNSGSSTNMRVYSLGHSHSTSGDYARSNYDSSRDFADMRRASAPAASFFPEPTTSYGSFASSANYIDGQGSPGPYSPISNYTYAGSTGSAGSDSDASQFFPPSFTAPRSAAPLDLPDISAHSYKAPTPVRLGSSTTFALSEQPLPQWYPNSGMACGIGGMGLAQINTMPVQVPSGRGTWNA